MIVSTVFQPRHRRRLPRGRRVCRAGAIAALGLLCGCEWVAPYRYVHADAALPSIREAAVADAADGGLDEGGSSGDTRSLVDADGAADVDRDADADGACGSGDASGGSSCGAVAGVAAGNAHACARRANGEVLCWGDNAHGQLGNGGTSGSLVPIAVAGIADAVQISAGANHTCARRESGEVLCWGESFGNMPVPVPGITKATDVASGAFWACAVVQQAIWCWGKIPKSQSASACAAVFTLHTAQPSPVAASGLTDATQIAIGFDHACARRASGQVACWGTNDCGQLGDGTTTFRSAAVAVSSVANATAITAGNSHTCARSSDGAIRCWGRNSAGQLGDGTQTHRHAPVLATQLSPADAVSAGEAHTCALQGGQVTCRGSDAWDALGLGGPPQTGYVANLSDAKLIEAGFFTGFAVRSTGGLVAWGYNLGGMLGDGTETSRNQPVVVLVP